MTDLSKQASIAQEIQTALKRRGVLSSSDLIPLCQSAFDSTDICRVLFDLKKTGLVTVADERVVNGKGKPVKFYRWVGPDLLSKTPSHYEPKPKAKPVVQAAESIEDEPVQPPGAPMAPAAITPAEAAALEAALAPPPLEPTAPPIDHADAPIDYAEVDDIEVAIRALQDHADAALLAVADLLLADHPLWRSLRQIADDTHHIHCHYRLLGVGANHV